jgi:hypothetical protein
MQHPSGRGVWRLTRKDGTGLPVDSVGHTAFEAHRAAWERIGGVAFSEFDFELVQDEAPPLPVEPAPVSPAIVRKVLRKRTIGRMVGAERGSVRPLASSPSHSPSSSYASSCAQACGPSLRARRPPRYPRC